MDPAPKDHFTPRHYAAKDTGGPVPFLNPTRRHIPLPSSGARPSPAVDEQHAAEEKPTEQPAYHIWRSRDNRKGRHAIAVKEGSAASSGVRPSDSPIEILKGLAKMAVRYPIWDVSYDVAMIYTLGMYEPSPALDSIHVLCRAHVRRGRAAHVPRIYLPRSNTPNPASGSVVWCINGFFVWYPLYRPSTYFPGEETTAGGISALVGATIFEVGATMAMLEAVNENRTDCFGWALEQAVEDGFLVARREHECRHHHRDRRSLFGPRRNRDGGGGGERGVEEKTNGKMEREDSDGGKEERSQTKGKRRWSWFPSWYELRTHYFHDIGFLGCLVQWMGATIFWIAGIVGMPSILGGMSVPLENGIYWLPQVSVYQYCPRGTCCLVGKLTLVPGHRRNRFHRLQLALHAGNPGEVV